MKSFSVPSCNRNFSSAFCYNIRLIKALNIFQINNITSVALKEAVICR